MNVAMILPSTVANPPTITQRISESVILPSNGDINIGLSVYMQLV